MVSLESDGGDRWQLVYAIPREWSESEPTSESPPCGGARENGIRVLVSKHTVHEGEGPGDLDLSHLHAPWATSVTSGGTDPGPCA